MSLLKTPLIEVKKFLADPDDFTISACPSQPQPLGRIMRTHNPKDFIKLLKHSFAILI